MCGVPCWHILRNGQGQSVCYLLCCIMVMILKICMQPTYVPIETQGSSRQAYFEPPVYERGSLMPPKISAPVQEVVMTSPVQEVYATGTQYTTSGPPRPITSPGIYASAPGPEYGLPEHGMPHHYDSRR